MPTSPFAAAAAPRTLEKERSAGNRQAARDAMASTVTCAISGGRMKADRQHQLAEAAGNDQMAAVLLDMPTYVRRAITQFGEDWTGERQIDLAAVSVTRKRQRDALWRARKDERLMRQQDRRGVVGDFRERARQIVKAAPMAGAGADRHLVGKAREPERRAILR
ncbi:MAG TPA: hypothetical protein VIE47_02250 [Methylocystis sp.]